MVLELFASVAQADPAPIAAGMLLLLALGMYPVGILLPCSSCCGCANCDTGTLPQTVTVTFPAWDDEMPGEYRHRIAFSTLTPWAANAKPASARVSATVAGEITAVEILDGGSGYALKGRVAPALTIAGGGGTGATFSPTLTSSGTPAVWTLASATASGGSGYVDGSSLTITAAVGDTVVAVAQATVTASGGAATGVTVTSGGSYYREDNAVAPYVASVTANVENGGEGLDAPTLTPVVDDDPTSATFGRIESVTITDGGGGHKYRSLYLGRKCCKPVFQSKSFVLTRNPSDPCQFIYRKCEGFGETRLVLTVPSSTTEYGPQPPFLETFSNDMGVYTGDHATTFCYTRWTATTLVPNCSDFEFEMESGDRIATVATGGAYHSGEFPQICSRCCPAGTLPDEIEVELESLPYNPVPWLTLSDFTGWEGTYVLESGAVFNDGGGSSAAWSFAGEIPSLGAPTIEVRAGGFSFGLATLSGSGTPATYTVTGVTIMDPGAWFTVGTPVTFDIIYAGTSAPPATPATGTISSVGANGEILAVTITNPGSYIGHWLRMQVQFQHCGAAAVLPEGVGTPDAEAEWPNYAVRFQDYLSYCATECSDKCFLIASISRTAGDDVESISTQWDDSRPYSATTLDNCGALYDYSDMDGYECSRWPGRPEWPDTTCDACEADLCSLTGKQITIRYNGFNRARLTVQ